MPEFSPAGYLLLGLTAIVGFLAGVLAFALLRIMGAARDSGRHLRESNVETALLSAALQEAVTKLRRRSGRRLARAEASERLNAQIVDGLTSGLLVAGGDGRVRMLNPAGHRILGVAPRPMPAPTSTTCCRTCPRWRRWCATPSTTAAPPCRAATSPPALVGGPSHLGVTLSPWSAARPGKPASSACSPICRAWSRSKSSCG